MVQVDFHINGRKVSPYRLASPLQAALLEDAANTINAALGALRCPIHHRLPRVLATGASVYGLAFTVTGCCPAFRERATRLLEERVGDQRPALVLETPRPRDAA